MVMQGLTQTPNYVEENMFDARKLPFQISIVDAETHLCAICLFKYRFATETKQKTDELVTCKGCDIY